VHRDICSAVAAIIPCPGQIHDLPACPWLATPEEKRIAVPRRQPPVDAGEKSENGQEKDAEEDRALLEAGHCRDFSGLSSVMKQRMVIGA
jgi:hypothetical protein